VFDRARYYSPTQGRFISQDPLGFATGTTNLYNYANSDPTDLTDPTGTDPLIPLACAVGGGLSVALDWGTASASGRKYTLGDGLASFATGCVIGALTTLIGPEALPIARSLKLGANLAEAAPIAAEEGGAGWKVGDSITALTKAGNEPAWSTVRGRYWKNAADAALDGEYSAPNLARMGRGLAALHDELGVSMELNHIVPRYMGGGHDIENLEQLWRWEHAAVDPFRFYNGPTP
jgi:uncharacterized protein RhaS with RHS repeats